MSQDHRTVTDAQDETHLRWAQLAKLGPDLAGVDETTLDSRAALAASYYHAVTPEDLEAMPLSRLGHLVQGVHEWADLDSSTFGAQATRIAEHLYTRYDVDLQESVLDAGRESRDSLAAITRSEVGASRYAEYDDRRAGVIQRARLLSERAERSPARAPGRAPIHERSEASRERSELAAAEDQARVLGRAEPEAGLG